MTNELKKPVLTIDDIKTLEFNGRSLRPHQVENLKQMLKWKNVFLADEMGLGKSVQSVAFANLIQAANILVVCPASLRLNWQMEFSKWFTNYKKENVKCIFTTRDKIKDEKIIICSYDLSYKSNIHSQLASRWWDLIIYDEASFYFMKEDTKRTKACLKDFWPTAKRNLALCGTPVPGSIKAAFPLFNRFAPDLFPEYYSFCNRYSNRKEMYIRMKGGRKRKIVKYEGGRNLPQLKKLITERFIVRKTKKEVLKELPDKVYQTIPVEAVRHIHTKLEDGVTKRILQRLDNNEPVIIDDAIAKTRRLIGEAKIKAAIDHIKEVMHEKKKLVVFAHHKNVIAALSEELSNDFSLGVVSGKTAPVERQRIVEDFQNGELQIFIGNIQAAGTGLTLTAADTCVFVELDWSPANVAQAIDRLHRIGQKNSVLVQYLVQADTIDGHVLNVLKKKIETINQVVD